MSKFFSIASGILVILIIMLIGFGYFFVEGMCENSEIVSWKSPNQQWKVVLFERSCGATTGFTSQISLIDSGVNLKNSPGNVYIANDYLNNYTLSWISNKKIKVTGSNPKAILKKAWLNGIEFVSE